MRHDSPQVWLVWSNEHGAFWAVGDSGYTLDLDRAARYTREEAEKRCQKIGPFKWGSTPDEVALIAPESL